MGQEDRAWRQANRAIGMFADTIKNLADAARINGTPLTPEFRDDIENGRCNVVTYTSAQSPAMLSKVRDAGIDYAEGSCFLDRPDGETRAEVRVGFFRKDDEPVISKCIEEVRRSRGFGQHELPAVIFKERHLSDQTAEIIKGLTPEEIAYIKNRAIVSNKVIGVSEKEKLTRTRQRTKEYSVYVDKDSREWAKKVLSELSMINRFKSGKEYLEDRAFNEELNYKNFQTALSTDKQLYVISREQPYKYISVNENVYELHRVITKDGLRLDDACTPVEKNNRGMATTEAKIELKNAIDNWIGQSIIVTKEELTKQFGKKEYKDIDEAELTKYIRSKFAKERKEELAKSKKGEVIELTDKRIINNSLRMHDTLSAIAAARNEANLNIQKEIDSRKVDLQQKGSTISEEEKKLYISKIGELEDLKKEPIRFMSTEKYDRDVAPQTFFGLQNYEQYLSADTLNHLNDTCSIKGTIFTLDPLKSDLTPEQKADRVEMEKLTLTALEENINLPSKDAYSMNDIELAMSLEDKLQAFAYPEERMGDLENDLSTPDGTTVMLMDDVEQLDDGRRLDHETGEVTGPEDSTDIGDDDDMQITSPEDDSAEERDLD